MLIAVQVNAADAFDIGSFDEEDTKGEERSRLLSLKQPSLLTCASIGPNIRV